MKPGGIAEAASNFTINETWWNSRGSKDLVTLFEIIKLHAGWESFAADTDTFQPTVATELVKNKLPIDLSRCLVFVGDNTTDKMRMCCHQGVHQAFQLFLVTV